MSYTETDYYKILTYLMPLEELQFQVNKEYYPSITLTQFENASPELPSSSDAALQCLASVARGTYHLFYAIVIGLPTDWLTFKTHVFLVTWEQVKFDAYDAYTHALTVTDPLNGAFLQQESLFLRESQQEPKTTQAPREKDTLPLPKKPIPTTPTTPRMPPNLLKSLTTRSPVTDRGSVTEKPKTRVIPPVFNPPSKNTGSNPDLTQLSPKERFKAMQAHLTKTGIGSTSRPATRGTGTPLPRDPKPSTGGTLVPKKPSDTWKGGKIDAGKFGNIAEMLGNRNK